uniref:Chromosome alignment maintaining phosphoprotein 1 n=1 Tax=Rousettus aegyptiacus TaxID=9407 RepID=A0A7J8DW77_ROUAE|nr:chromosome alignment maintaining phosphoprotein 1 [Rousettus aegyptiacus]
MTSFLPNILCEFGSQAPSPSKDFHYLIIVETEVTTGQIKKVFGKEVLHYSLNLCQGKFDLLVRMPDNILLQIFSFLHLDDIEQLSKTCRKFQKLCSNEEVWEKFGALQDKHTFDAKKIGITICKKLQLSTKMQPNRSSHREDRQHFSKLN